MEEEGSKAKESGSKSNLNPRTDGISSEVNSGPGLRGSLVDLAVKFLNNPRVFDKPLEDKKIFLTKKGLTDAEINAALRIADQHSTTSAVVPSSSPPPLPPRPVVSHPRSRTWSEYAIMAAFVGGVSYVVVQFLRTYVIPWLQAPSSQKQKLDDVQASINQLQSTVGESIISLGESTKSIQALLSEQQQHIQLLTTQVTGLQASLAQQTDGQPFRQLKEEVSSLKGILLSRHQFPPTPNRAVTNGIPIWQRTSDPGNSTKKPLDESGHAGEVKFGTETYSVDESQNGFENGTVTYSVDENQNGNGV